jgi:hypothetical protein
VGLNGNADASVRVISITGDEERIGVRLCK